MPNDDRHPGDRRRRAGEHLTADHAAAVLAEIMEGRASEVQTGAFLIALRAKGETVPELVGLARTMRSLADSGRDRRARSRRHRRAPAAGPRPSTSRPRRRWSRPRPAAPSPSTATAPSTSRSRLRRPARGARGQHRARARRRSARCIDEVGFGFMFAPRHHAAMAHVVPVRKELGGADDLQLPRPADQPGRGAERQLLGVSDRHYQETIAEALVGLGSVRAMVVSAEDGVDELSISARTRVIEVDERRDRRRASSSRATSASPRPSSDDVAGGTPEENAAATRAVLARRARVRGATWSCSTPAPRSTSAAAPRASPTGSRRPPRRSTRARQRDLARAADRGDRRALGV